MTSDGCLPMKQKQVLRWVCLDCAHECIPIRSESRCICGHRLKEHDENRCRNKTCNCNQFFYIVAEGSWILRCRCKHKHIEHDANTHSCKKSSCSCKKFDSPWVCNCNHPWSRHEQQLTTTEVADLGALVEATEGVEMEKNVGWEVNRWDLVKRGEDSQWL